MKNLILVLIILIMAAATYYLLQQGDRQTGTTEPLPVQLKQPDTEDTAQAELEIQYPVPESAGDKYIESEEKPDPISLLKLDDSDDAIKNGLSEIYSISELGKLLLLNSIIRHFVITVNNFPEKKLPQKYKINSQPSGKFIVRQDADGSLFIKDENYSRYVPYIKLAETIELEKLTELYFRYYPLFQDAYNELGYPDKYFNDRFVEVIDHLLATPDVPGEIELIQPEVYYKYADPELESLSAGQKILIRMGYYNAEVIKKRLIRLRELLTRSNRYLNI